jgi:hypothetical protein
MKDPSPSSNRTGGFPSFGFARGLSHAAFTDKSVPTVGSTHRRSAPELVSTVVGFCGAGAGLLVDLSLLLSHDLSLFLDLSLPVCCSII